MQFGLIESGTGVRVVAVEGDVVRLSSTVLAPSDANAWSAEVARLAAEPTSYDDVRPLESVRLRAPLPQPGKVVAVGLNYVDHAAEGNMAVPTSPLLFSKFPSTMIGPGDEICWSAEDTEFVDYEAELGVVIGTTVRNVAEADALDAVLGYTCVNDVSARDLQFGDGQWVRGKSLETFLPVGPVIVTPDEVGDPQRLSITCDIDGEVLQHATTADMMFSVASLIAYCSRFFALHPGDLIATGTPPGVGWFRDPRRALHHGDNVRVTIGGIGTLSNPCVVAQ